MWAFTNKHIIYTQDRDGDENRVVYVIDLTDGKTIALTPPEGVAAKLFPLSEKYPDEILVGLNERNSNFQDVYSINFITGKRTLVYTNNRYFDLISDSNFQVRFGYKQQPDGGYSLEKLDSKNTGHQLLQVPFADYNTWGLHLDQTGKILYLTDTLERNTTAVSAINLETGMKTVLASDPAVDVDDVYAITQNPKSGRIQAAAFATDRRKWQVIDSNLTGDINYLSQAEPGELYIIDRSLNDQYWIVSYVTDQSSDIYYLYDHFNKTLHPLINSPLQSSLPFASTKPIHFAARDGTIISGFLTIPLWQENYFPLIVLIHGGPHDRDFWDFNPERQWLANRGYAVLNVNFRGSRGFGKNFLNQGSQQWGGTILNDITDGINWAIHQNITRSGKIAVMGSSFGGYASLMLAAKIPNQLTSAISFAGPVDLISDLERRAETGNPTLESELAREGDFRSVSGRKLLTQYSPISLTNLPNVPVLIGQGIQDARVTKEDIDRYVEVLSKAKKPRTYLVFPEEGHFISNDENQMAYYGAVEAFLSVHLKGKLEPIGNTLSNTNLQIPVNTNVIPGIPMSTVQ